MEMIHFWRKRRRIGEFPQFAPNWRIFRVWDACGRTGRLYRRDSPPEPNIDLERKEEKGKDQSTKISDRWCFVRLTEMKERYNVFYKLLRLTDILSVVNYESHLSVHYYSTL